MKLLDSVKRQRMGRLSTLILLLGITGCAELFSAHPQVVARVDGQELSVERLAELLVLGQPLPLTDEVGAELATHWIDVAALAQRMVEGDSLWDSTFVREAMWLNLQQLAITRFRDQLASGNVTVTPATVDSAFRVGEHRVVAHVLKAVPAGSSPDYRREQRTAAENIFEQLRRGGSWEAANAVSDDSVARVNNGNLGVLPSRNGAPAVSKMQRTLSIRAPYLRWLRRSTGITSSFVQCCKMCDHNSRISSNRSCAHGLTVPTTPSWCRNTTFG